MLGFDVGFDSADAGEKVFVKRATKGALVGQAIVVVDDIGVQSFQGVEESFEGGGLEFGVAGGIIGDGFKCENEIGEMAVERAIGLFRLGDSSCGSCIGMLWILWVNKCCFFGDAAVVTQTIQVFKNVLIFVRFFSKLGFDRGS